MKTAMQNHISDMKQIQEMVKSKNLDKDLEETILVSIDGCIENAQSFLEEEKEHIKSAYGAGAMDASYDFDNVDSEQYYQQTFKSEQ